MTQILQGRLEENPEWKCEEAALCLGESIQHKGKEREKGSMKPAELVTHKLTFSYIVFLILYWMCKGETSIHPAAVPLSLSLCSQL